jgi:dipeptidyl aminopeptidase/acylaminoacyl peptidase
MWSRSIARCVVPLVVAVLFLAPVARGQQAQETTPASRAAGLPDGTLLTSEPCPAREPVTHEAYVEGVRSFLERDRELAARENITAPPVPSEEALRAALLAPDELAARLAYRGYECRAITYASGGLEIAGFLWKPAATEGRTFPLVVFTRGGNRDFGALSPWSRWGFYDFLDAGYVVLGSQYRGGPGSEGEDEFGGRDLDDVLALFPLAEGLGYVDLDDAFIFGGSRGGMMALLAARRGAPVRAVAIQAPTTDLTDLLDPDRGGRPAFHDLFTEIMPGYVENPKQALEARSAVFWADEIDVPVIVFHGTADWRVEPAESLAFAAALERAGETAFELHLYDGDGHSLLLNWRDVTARTLGYFERYRLPRSSE